MSKSIFNRRILPTFVNQIVAMVQQQVMVRDLGSIGYQEAWDYQENLLAGNVQIKTEARLAQRETNPHDLSTQHYFLFCEHPPVYTLGKSGKMEHLLWNEEQLANRGVTFIKTNRGGDITFHGPGQIVGYPILDLEKFKTDIGLFLRNVEEVIIRTIAEYGIVGGRSQGETGVWIDAGVPGKERKICAIGVRCSRWVTMHGFALNVNTNLDYFNGIVPCGIVNKQVTSMQRELGSDVDIEEVKSVIKKHVEAVFDVRLLTN